MVTIYLIEIERENTSCIFWGCFIQTIIVLQFMAICNSSIVLKHSWECQVEWLSLSFGLMKYVKQNNNINVVILLEQSSRNEYLMSFGTLTKTWVEMLAFFYDFLTKIQLFKIKHYHRSKSRGGGGTRFWRKIERTFFTQWIRRVPDPLLKVMW